LAFSISLESRNRIGGCIGTCRRALVYILESEGALGSASASTASICVSLGSKTVAGAKETIG